MFHKMRLSFTTRMAACFAALLLACASVVLLAGCTQQVSTSTSEDAASQNRQYMAQINQKMDTLTERLEGFSDAVAQGDVVTMRTQADYAFEVIDEISDLSAPDALGDIQTGYAEGCSQLRDALSAYIDLYAEIESATDSEPFDYSTYEERLAAIQTQYDQGLEKLSEADKIATEMN